MIPEKLRETPKWCVSKNKMPLDMFALKKGLEWGASTKRSHPCYDTFDNACEMGRIQNLPVTILLDSAETGYYIIDIEKTCPAEIRQHILLALHDSIEYIERSLSGKGFHAVVRMDAPETLTTVKYRKWVEILSNHHCTFTMDEISIPDAYYASIPENEKLNPEGSDHGEEDRALLEKTSRTLTPSKFYAIIGEGRTVVIGEAADIGEYKKALSTFDGKHADLFTTLCDMVYEKSLDDFNGDASRWEFGYASKMHYLLQRASRDMIAADLSHYQVDLTQSQAVMLVFMALKQMLPPREKHREVRNGLPWLLYTSQQVYIKTWP